MKYLKNISLFKLSLLLLVNLFFADELILFITFLYLFITDKKEIIIFICLLSFCTIFNNYRYDFIPIGIVEEKYNNYVLVDKLLYKEYLYEDKEIGDIVYIKGNKIEEEKFLKYNYCFKSNKSKLIYNSKIRTLVSKQFNKFNEDTKAILRKILLNKYSDDVDVSYLGYGFAFYYLLLYFVKNNKKICLLLLIVYIILFGFDLKFYLIIIELISNKHFKGLDKLSIKLISLLIINKYLLINKGILLSLIFSYYYNSELNWDKSLILAIQSYFFYQTNILSIFIYKYFIMMRISLFLISFIVFLFPQLSAIYLSFISLFSSIYSLFTLSIRGQIPEVLFALIYLIFYYFNFKVFLRVLVLTLLLLLPINTMTYHLSFIDVGQGDASLITYNFKNILIDTGSKYNYHKLKNELYRQGIYKIDYLIITHNDEDHNGNIVNLNKDFKIDKIIYDGEDIFLNNALLYYLNIDTFDNDNDNSLVYLFQYDDLKVLFPGDISKKVENLLIEKYSLNDIDIYHIAHHGSNTSTDEYFIGSINIKAAIISTNGKYNHPHKETIDTLDKYQVEIFNTKEEGNIYLYRLFNKYVLKGKKKIMVFN